MKRIIISDTSCLIVLSKINALDILRKMFGEIWITQEVSNEFGENLPEWFIVKTAKNAHIEKILKLNLDRGEASSMALCLEQDNALLIIDERKGRKIAKDLGIHIIGTIGIILLAEKSGIITHLEDIIEQLENTDFRISPVLKAEMLSRKNLHK